MVKKYKIEKFKFFEFFFDKGILYFNIKILKIGLLRHLIRNLELYRRLDNLIKNHLKNRLKYLISNHSIHRLLLNKYT